MNSHKHVEQLIRDQMMIGVKSPRQNSRPKVLAGNELGVWMVEHFDEPLRRHSKQHKVLLFTSRYMAIGVPLGDMYVIRFSGTT
jgi:hypothetical protein